MKVVSLKRSIVRRIGRLVIRVTPAGVELRGKHRRRWRALSWAQIAGLAVNDDPLLVAIEETAGRKVLDRIGAVEPNAEHEPEESTT